MTPAPLSRSDTPFNRFVFYDVETTGLSPAFDQILQLAAIRTGPSFSDSSQASRFTIYASGARGTSCPPQPRC